MTFEQTKLVLKNTTFQCHEVSTHLDFGSREMAIDLLLTMVSNLNQVLIAAQTDTLKRKE